MLQETAVPRMDFLSELERLSSKGRVGQEEVRCRARATST